MSCHGDRLPVREGTFIISADQQRSALSAYQQIRERHLSQSSQASKPLSFSARSFQRTHPGMMRPDRKGVIHTDADATLVSLMLVGVADGISSLDVLEIDGSELPNELLQAAKEIAMQQLVSHQTGLPDDSYGGPISLLKEAYEATESLGSTTVLLGILDNSSTVHGQMHPMIAVLTIGDCELLLLRRPKGPQSPLEVVFHTETQRVNAEGCKQRTEDRVHVPMQLGRVDARVDPDFHEDLAIEVIEKGSAVQVVSTFEGDIAILGSDGVFDNVFVHELVDSCNYFMPPSTEESFEPIHPAVLTQIARQIVHNSHAKTKAGAKRHMPDTPIGKGGKMDDTSVVVAEVVEWTEDLSSAWSQRPWDDFFRCGIEDDDRRGRADLTCNAFDSEEEEEEEIYDEATRVLVDL